MVALKGARSTVVSITTGVASNLTCQVGQRRRANACTTGASTPPALGPCHHGSSRCQRWSILLLANSRPSIGWIPSTRRMASAYATSHGRKSHRSRAIPTVSAISRTTRSAGGTGRCSAFTAYPPEKPHQAAARRSAARALRRRLGGLRARFRSGAGPRVRRSARRPAPAPHLRPGGNGIAVVRAWTAACRALLQRDARGVCARPTRRRSISATGCRSTTTPTRCARWRRMSTRSRSTTTSTPPTAGSRPISSTACAI